MNLVSISRISIVLDQMSWNALKSLIMDVGGNLGSLLHPEIRMFLWMETGIIVVAPLSSPAAPLLLPMWVTKPMIVSERGISSSSSKHMRVISLTHRMKALSKANMAKLEFHTGTHIVQTSQLRPILTPF